MRLTQIFVSLSGRFFIHWFCIRIWIWIPHAGGWCWCWIADPDYWKLLPEVFVEGDLWEELGKGLLHGGHGQIAGFGPATITTKKETTTFIFEKFATISTKKETTFMFEKLTAITTKKETTTLIFENFVFSFTHAQKSCFSCFMNQNREKTHDFLSLSRNNLMLSSPNFVFVEIYFLPIIYVNLLFQCLFSKKTHIFLLNDLQ